MGYRLLLLAVLAASCAAPDTDGQVEIEYSEPDTSLPHGAIRVGQGDWSYQVLTGGLDYPEDGEPSGYPGQPWAIEWARIGGAEEGEELYRLECHGPILGWLAGIEQTPEPSSIYFTFGIQQSEGYHIPLQMWIDEERTLVLDYYQEAFQGTYGPPSMGPGTHFLVLSEVDPSRFDALGARYLGEHETDGW